MSDDTLRRENIYRAAMPGLELRDAGNDEMPTLYGHFSVFNSPTIIRGEADFDFVEVVAPGAFRKTLSENPNFKVMFNHGRDPQIGQKLLGTPRASGEDDTGAFYEVPLYDTSFNRDLLPGLRDGAYGASFHFSVVQHELNRDAKASPSNPDGLPVRTIKEVKLHEAGPVSWPAYDQATSGVRSLTRMIADIDALMLATPILLDEERLERAQLWVKRNVTAESGDTDEKRDAETAEVVEDAASAEAEAEATNDRKADHSPEDAATKSHILSESREPGRSHLLTPKREGASSLL